MRRILTTGLLVSTILAMAVPATAQSRDGRDRGVSNSNQRHAQAASPDRRGSSPARAPQAARPAPERAPSAVQTRPVPPSTSARVQQPPSTAPGANNRPNPANPANPVRGAQRPGPSAPSAQQARPSRDGGNWQRDARRNDEARRGDNDRNWQRGDRPGRVPGATGPTSSGNPRYNANRDQRGQNWRNDNQRPNVRNPVRLQDRQRWSSSWRNDRRYDWQGYRSQHRNIYRMPAYRPPYGWNRGYSRFSIGIILNSFLFDQSYWINDPYYYRLPPAYGSLRWVRYYDDALLVDIRDGYVVDVIHNFFW
ncbi:MAG TPA: RcnB family protein [Sphingobium sp.]|nr:RcnB family protein [Sphingobium sp.]